MNRQRERHFGYGLADDQRSLPEADEAAALGRGFADTVTGRQRGRARRSLQVQFLRQGVSEGKIQRPAVNVHEQEMGALLQVAEVTCQVEGSRGRPILVAWRDQFDCGDHAALRRDVKRGLRVDFLARCRRCIDVNAVFRRQQRLDVTQQLNNPKYALAIPASEFVPIVRRHRQLFLGSHFVPIVTARN